MACRRDRQAVGTRDEPERERVALGIGRGERPGIGGPLVDGGIGLVVEDGGGRRSHPDGEGGRVVERGRAVIDHADRERMVASHTTGPADGTAGRVDAGARGAIDEAEGQGVGGEVGIGRIGIGVEGIARAELDIRECAMTGGRLTSDTRQA